VVGRPNVGKSTLVNRLLGEERMIAFDEPGTTRDAVEVPFAREGQAYVLVDTAGMRRRARVDEGVEKVSAIKTLQAIDDAHVVIGVLDARETVAEQDATLFGIVAERGRALVIAVNKWDHVATARREELRAELAARLRFLDFAPLHFISALHGSGVGELMESVRAAYAAAMRDLPTPELTRVLEAAMTQHQPPLVRGRRIRLRYAHQGGRNPPVIVVHGSQAERTPEDYRRYLTHCFRQAFRLAGTPVRVNFRSEENPFAGRRDRQTPRQRRTRERRAERRR
jgi:GTP-binding protein